MDNKYEGSTPGPWKCEGTINDEHVFTEDGEWVCQLWGKQEENFRSDEETAANCDLIADAPMLAEQNTKMLAMLKEVISHEEWEACGFSQTGRIEYLIAEIEG